MQSRCLEPIGRRLTRVASGFVCSLILAMGLFTQRVARADSKETGQAVVAAPSGQPTQGRGGGIEGVVKDDKGKPIAGAHVENPERDKHAARRTLTDKNGHYTLDDLNERPDGFRVLVRAAGYGPVEQEVKPGDAGKPERVDFTLSHGHVLRGRVVDEAGKPISGVRVSTFGANSLLELATQSDEDGRFEIDSLPGDARFSIAKSGYSGLWHVPLRLDSGLLTVVLEPMGTIRGRVVDAQSGKPLDHFSVWLTSRRRSDGSTIPGGRDRVLAYPGKTFASSDGTFLIRDMTNRMPVEVSVAADGHAKCVLPRVVTAPLDEADALAFALAPIEPAKSTTISGFVLDHSGQPAGGVNLRLIISPKPSHDPALRRLLGSASEIAGLWFCDQVLDTISDSQGRFEFRNVLPDKYWQLEYMGQNVRRCHVFGAARTVPGSMRSLRIKLPPPSWWPHL